MSYENIPTALDAYRTRLQDLQEENSDLTLALYASQRLLFKTEKAIKLGDKKLSVEYSHSQTSTTSRILLNRLDAINASIQYVETAINALNEFARHRLAVDTVDAIFSQSSSPLIIQETIDTCENELTVMEKKNQTTMSKFLAKHKGHAAFEEARTVFAEVEVRTQAKKNVIEKLKALLGRSRTPGNDEEHHAEVQETALKN